MPEQPTSFSEFQQPGDGAAADAWHDLVAAVVAVNSSARVCPPAAMLGAIERELGFASARAPWWAAPRVLGGIAAALAVSLGWMAWRASATGDGGAQVATVAPASSSGGPDSSVALHATAGGAVAANPTAKANSAGAPGPAGTAVAATIGAASSAPPSPAPAKQPGAGAAATAAGQRGVTRGAGETLAGSGGFSGDGSAFAQSSGRLKGDAPIELKSDFYVVGMIAAALQDPVSANPYESVAQPLEWTDWRSGYEFGEELPPEETLALSATWTWQDPRNQSLVAGAASDVPGISASISGTKPVVDPGLGSTASITASKPPADSGVGASASSVAPEPEAGSEARIGGSAPADEPKKP
jgi:hypothetical protein